MQPSKIVIAFTFVAGMASGAGLYAAFNAAGNGGEPACPEAPQPHKISVGDRISGPVESVYDGDTMTLIVRGESIKVRSWAIDAPEKGQTCGKGGKSVSCGILARDALATMVKNKDVSCEVKDIDPNKRPVGHCQADGKDLNREMVRKGMAIEDKRYSKGAFSADETYARDRKAGLWGMEFLTPSEWRTCKLVAGRGLDLPPACTSPLTGPPAKAKKTKGPAL